MNQGFFGFSSSTSANIISIAEFETSGTYSVPAGTQWLEIYAIGAGGGGGSGRRGASSTARYAGGGGQSATYVIDTVSLIDLKMTVGSEITVIIGAGGTGGGVVSINDTSGNAGNSGGATQLLKQGFRNEFLTALGGSGANGGSTTSGTGGSFTRSYLMRGTPTLVSSGGSASISAVADYNMGTGFSGTNPIGTYCPHGAAGGSISTVNTAYAGGNVIFNTSATRLTCALSSSTSTTIVAGSAANTAQKGGNGIQSFPSYGSLRTGATFGFGYGGAGGGAGATTNAGDGGDGYRGGGGGGGGASLNGFNSGAGGRGGDGYCCIIAWR